MELKEKHFIINNYFRFLCRSLIPRNFLVDKLVMPVPFDDLSKLHGIEITYLDISSSDYEKWVEQYFPTWRSRFGHLRHKKLMEFFTTFTLLDPCPNDVFIDAAGGADTYLHTLECRKRYLQDIVISQDLKSRLGNKIEYIESDASEIPLPDGSVDKISCHHSFEHFQKSSDILFIKEIQRLLKQNGRACIIQLFIADRYVEVTDALTFKMKFDSRSRRIIDPTATLPGGRHCGNYARVYDLTAFQERVLNNVNLAEFKITIAELQIDGDIVPDLVLDCHKHVTVINRPYRAMLIEKFSVTRFRRSVNVYVQND